MREWTGGRGAVVGVAGLVAIALLGGQEAVLVRVLLHHGSVHGLMAVR